MLSNYHICIQGQVQGVGFRPHVYTIATELGLAGAVYNDGSGVQIKLVANQQQLDTFMSRLSESLPALAAIDAISVEHSDDVFTTPEFSILTSQSTAISTQISPDAATCEHCLSELLDPNNRRFHYPFINCTHCGPRFSIIKKLPYDRQYTTMADFILCAQCQQEYHSPLDRRFHAQPNACPDCGPTLTLVDHQLTSVNAQDLVKKTVQLLQQGHIIAIKGIGGFHLVCDALNLDAVTRLRAKKQRKTKPLTMMVANLANAKQLVNVSTKAEQQLTSRYAPIVVMRTKTTTFEYLAPKMNSLGIMLPYSPLHHLLFQHSEQPLYLVMTSANLRDQPLVYQDEKLSSLASLADYILTHNRPIHKRIDDAIVNCLEENDNAIVVRRGRGMAPKAIDLAFEGKPTLALGGFFKNSICLTQGKKAYLSHYLGNLDHPDNCRYLQETVAHMIEVFQLHPQQVVADLHPNFFSSQFAQQFALKHKIPLINIQHHHAHAAAVACEHHITSPYIAISLDGVGMGDDGESWGGECLQIKGAHCSRIGHVLPLLLPGGDSAAKQPWRIATAFLIQHQQSELAQQRFGHETGFAVVKQMVARNLNCPKTSSVGRLFDLAAALLGLTTSNSFEAEAAMLLESASTQGKVMVTDELFHISADNVLDFTALLLKLTTMKVNDGAATFHYQLALGLSKWLPTVATGDIDQVVLAGGCFLNQALTTALQQRLTASGFKVFSAKQVPPNDGSLALGQAWAAIVQNQCDEPAEPNHQQNNRITLRSNVCV